MAVARTIERESQTAELVVVPSTRVSAQMVKKAKRASELRAIIYHAEHELEPIKSTFDDHFRRTGTAQATDASGKVIAWRTHGEPNTLDQAHLWSRYPKVAEACTWPHPWDSVGWAKFE